MASRAAFASTGSTVSMPRMNSVTPMRMAVASNKSAMSPALAGTVASAASAVAVPAPPPALPTSSATAAPPPPPASTAGAFAKPPASLAAPLAAASATAAATSTQAPAAAGATAAVAAASPPVEPERRLFLPQSTETKFAYVFTSSERARIKVRLPITVGQLRNRHRLMHFLLAADEKGRAFDPPVRYDDDSVFLRDNATYRIIEVERNVQCFCWPFSLCYRSSVHKYPRVLVSPAATSGTAGERLRAQLQIHATDDSAAPTRPGTTNGAARRLAMAQSRAAAYAGGADAAPADSDDASNGPGRVMTDTDDGDGEPPRVT